MEKKSYPEIAGWTRAKLSFAILRATTLCLRGSRTKWRSGTAIDDGAGLPDVEYYVYYTVIIILYFIFSIHLLVFLCMYLLLIIVMY